MMNNKSFEIQNQIRQSAQQAHEQIKNLKNWETEMKDKEVEMKKQLEQQSTEASQVTILFISSDTKFTLTKNH
jgi:hypothetical protein